MSCEYDKDECFKYGLELARMSLALLYLGLDECETPEDFKREIDSIEELAHCLRVGFNEWEVDHIAN